MNIKVDNCSIDQAKDRDIVHFSVEIVNAENEKLLEIPKEVLESAKDRKILIGFSIEDFIKYIEEYQERKPNIRLGLTQENLDNLGKKAMSV
jgi:hypothetical protein